MDIINDRSLSRDVIERFLDRSWMLDRTPLPALNGYRFALNLLDDWLTRHRVATLTNASASDVRALLKSKTWDVVSCRCDSLLGLVTRFYQSLQMSSLRDDDPWDTMIVEQIAHAARKRVVRPKVREKTRRTLLLDHPEVV
ncbi:MAG TPA: hypothetical protein VIV63_11945 [Steroidobacteraceae bacterium]